MKGLGIDIIEIKRLAQAIEQYGDKFLKKVFTDHELNYCSHKGKLKIPELAVRFAAKEAYMKARGTGMKGIGFKEIEICNDRRGQPYLKYRNRLLSRAFLSLSHSEGLAVANVVLM